MSDIGVAAAAIAAGRLDARLDAGDDKELFALATGFNAMVETLQERIERDARFASDVSHELRSPLTTLHSSAEVMLARRDRLDPRSARALDLLTDEIGRFERLVEDLLEISRYDAGAAVIELEPVDVVKLVGSVLDETGQDGVDVESPSSVVTIADRRRLGQAVRNLVSNAGTHGGGVTRVTVASSGDDVRIAVEDRGPGVAPEDREAIFGRFSRGRGARRRGSSDGVGLGLALTSEHVRVQGGRVWVEDASPCGARFVIQLPLQQP